jgi:hypothetical protein
MSARRYADKNHKATENADGCDFRSSHLCDLRTKDIWRQRPRTKSDPSESHHVRREKREGKITSPPAAANSKKRKQHKSKRCC